MGIEFQFQYGRYGCYLPSPDPAEYSGELRVERIDKTQRHFEAMGTDYSKPPVILVAGRFNLNEPNFIVDEIEHLVAFNGTLICLISGVDLPVVHQFLNQAKEEEDLKAEYFKKVSIAAELNNSTEAEFQFKIDDLICSFDAAFKWFLRFAEWPSKATQLNIKNMGYNHVAFWKEFEETRNAPQFTVSELCKNDLIYQEKYLEFKEPIQHNYARAKTTRKYPFQENRRTVCFKKGIQKAHRGGSRRRY